MPAIVAGHAVVLFQRVAGRMGLRDLRHDDDGLERAAVAAAVVYVGNAEAVEMLELRGQAASARAMRLIGQREERIDLGAGRFSSRRVHEIMLPAEHISMLDIGAMLDECSSPRIWKCTPVSGRRTARRSADDPRLRQFQGFGGLDAIQPSARGVATGDYAPLPSLNADLMLTACLERLTREHTHIALVRNAEGHVVGLITLKTCWRNWSARFKTSTTGCPSTRCRPVRRGWSAAGWVVAVEGTERNRLGRRSAGASARGKPANRQRLDHRPYAGAFPQRRYRRAARYLALRCAKYGGRKCSRPRSGASTNSALSIVIGGVPRVACPPVIAALLASQQWHPNHQSKADKALASRRTSYSSSYSSLRSSASRWRRSWAMMDVMACRYSRAASDKAPAWVADTADAVGRRNRSNPRSSSRSTPPVAQLSNDFGQPRQKIGVGPTVAGDVGAAAERRLSAARAPPRSDAKPPATAAAAATASSNEGHSGA